MFSDFELSKILFMSLYYVQIALLLLCDQISQRLKADAIVEQFDAKVNDKVSFRNLLLRMGSKLNLAVMLFCQK